MNTFSKISVCSAIGFLLGGMAVRGDEVGTPPTSFYRQVLAKYDSNHNGQIDEAEWDVRPQFAAAPGAPGRPHPPRLPKELMEKYDTNGDGQLDESERATLRQDIADGKVQPPAHLPRGPGRGTPELEEFHKELLEKYDANKDGILDDTERATIREDIQAGKLQPPTRPGGPGGPGPHPFRGRPARPAGA